MHLSIIAITAIFTVALVVIASVMATRWTTSNRRTVRFIPNVLLCTGTFLLLSLGLETYHFLFVQSDAFVYTLAGKRWQELHDNPYNRLGYRDHDPPLDDMNKKLLLVLGDSFAQGYGIRSIEDRFDRQLAARIGPEWMVASAARGGWDTLDELEAWRSYPRKPDLVVLQYFLNDVKHVLLANGLEEAPPPSQPGGFAGLLINHSFAINYWYWRVTRSNSKQMGSYWTNIRQAYTDDRLWAGHAAALDQVTAYARETETPLLVLLFPRMYDVAWSKPFTARVASHFEQARVPVVDLTPTFADRPASSLMANPMDGHPNERVHHEVGALLADKLKGLGWLD